MDYIKLSTRYYRDPALLTANERTGGQAELLFLRALAQCGADHTEGRVARTALPFLGIRNAERVAAILVDVGLWLADDGGWTVRSWDRWQSEHDALARRRQSDADRKRMQRVRGLSRDTSRDTSRGPSRDSPQPNARDYREGDRDSGYVEHDTHQSNGRARAHRSTTDDRVRAALDAGREVQALADRRALPGGQP